MMKTTAELKAELAYLDKLIAKIEKVEKSEMFISKRGDKDKNVRFAQSLGSGRKRKYKAVIQKNRFTGEERVFFYRLINGKTKVVYKNSPSGMLKVTSYPSLTQVLRETVGGICVGFDEQVLCDDRPCEDVLFA